MSFHYGQQVEVWLDHAFEDERGWFPGTVDTVHASPVGLPVGTLRVNLDPDGKRFIYRDPFYIRPREAS